MDQEVQHLSGGELQRVAITMALGMPADIYLIDEPSAYLDSEQRIIAAKVCLIKGFSVMVRVQVQRAVLLVCPEAAANAAAACWQLCMQRASSDGARSGDRLCYDLMVWVVLQVIKRFIMHSKKVCQQQCRVTAHHPITSCSQCSVSVLL